MTKEKSKSGEKLKELGEKLVRDIEKGKNPEITFALRNLSNVVFDQKSRTLKLGDKKGSRSFFNVAHAKKFLQTVEIARILKKELLDTGKHEHLRGVFYMAKRTIPGTNVNIVDEQMESLAPDQPILVRVGEKLQFRTGKELLDYVREHGKKIFDDGKKERYTNVGLKVCSFDEDYKIKELPVTLFIKHPSNKIKEIVTASGKSVKVTQSHSLFTSHDGFPLEKEVTHLKIGDWIAVPRKITVEEKTKEIDIIKNLISNCPTNVLHLLTLKGEIKTINTILKSIERKKLRQFVKEHYKSSLSVVLGNWRRSAIPLMLVKELGLDISAYYDKLKITCKGAKHQYRCKIDCNEDLGLILGLLLSEGSHSKANRKGERNISLSNKVKDYLEKFSSSFKKVFYEDTAGKIFYCSDGTWRLNVGYDLLSYIFEYALEYRVCYAWEKELPSFLFDANKETVKSYLRWYRNGDGSVHKKNKQVRFHTTSRALANATTFLLLRFGILSRIYSRKSKEKNHHLQYEIRIGDRDHVIKSSKITHDFKETDLRKKNNLSSDKLVDVGKLFRGSLDKLKLDEAAYKKFSWYNWDKQETVSRATLDNAVSLISKFGKIDEKLYTLLNYDIAWDKIVKIKDAGIAPYTVDLAVPPTQNFIGGNGLVILHNSDKVIEDLEVIADVSREEMHVSANKMGSMVGSIIIEDSGDTIDCSKLGRGGYSIPSITDELSFKKVSAKYILYMEKAAIFERLNEDKFWQKNDAILVTSQGQTTRGIRRLLQRLSEEKNLPIYVLTDFDCWGFYIYSVVKYGSIALAHASERLTIPNVKFLGITADDVLKYDLKKHLIKLNEQDLSRMKQVSEYAWFKDNKAWQRQLKMMKDFGGKAEIQALSARGISFISDKYLVEKIKNKEFLE